MPNGNQRGNTASRARRRALLLSPEGGWGGDGETVPCWECGVLCGPDDVDMVCDRIIPGERGGSYFDPDNVAPHCSLCSHRQGQRRAVAICKQRRTSVSPRLVERSSPQGVESPRSRVVDYSKATRKPDGAVTSGDESTTKESR